MIAQPVVRAAAMAAALLAGLAVALCAAAPPAQADNCQPEELIVRAATPDKSWESPVAPDERDPRCVGAAHVSCPNQADPVGCAAGVVQSTVSRVFSRGSTLGPDQTLRAGAFLQSDDGRYRLVMQDDGNLVQSGPSGVEWTSNTFGYLGARLVMQLDGNLVIYTSENQPVWSTNTFAGRSSLVVQNDSNLVVYGPGGPVWSRW